MQKNIGSATRPIFIPNRNSPAVLTQDIIFDWHMGMSSAVRKRSIASLHQHAHNKGIERILEASSKSDEAIGLDLSAFFLCNDNGIAVENLFQSSKVFVGNIQFKDLLNVTPREAKKDPRLKTSGKMEKFSYCSKDYPLNPTSLFYDWLYTKTLFTEKNNIALKDNFISKNYDAFSDIEFNPKKSFSCQARTLALIISLYSNDKIDDFLSDPVGFANAFKLYASSQA